MPGFSRFNKSGAASAAAAASGPATRTRRAAATAAATSASNDAPPNPVPADPAADTTNEFQDFERPATGGSTFMGFDDTRPSTGGSAFSAGLGGGDFGGIGMDGDVGDDDLDNGTAASGATNGHHHSTTNGDDISTLGTESMVGYDQQPYDDGTGGETYDDSQQQDQKPFGDEEAGTGTIASFGATGDNETDNFDGEEEEEMVEEKQQPGEQQPETGGASLGASAPSQNSPYGPTDPAANQKQSGMVGIAGGGGISALFAKKKSLSQLSQMSQQQQQQPTINAIANANTNATSSPGPTLETTSPTNPSANPTDIVNGGAGGGSPVPPPQGTQGTQGTTGGSNNANDTNADVRTKMTTGNGNVNGDKTLPMAGATAATTTVGGKSPSPPFSSTGGDGSPHSHQTKAADNIDGATASTQSPTKEDGKEHSPTPPSQDTTMATAANTMTLTMTTMTTSPTASDASDGPVPATNGIGNNGISNIDIAGQLLKTSTSATTAAPNGAPIVAKDTVAGNPRGTEGAGSQMRPAVNRSSTSAGSARSGMGGGTNGQAPAIGQQEGLIQAMQSKQSTRGVSTFAAFNQTAAPSKTVQHQYQHQQKTGRPTTTPGAGPFAGRSSGASGMGGGTDGQPPAGGHPLMDSNLRSNGIGPGMGGRVVPGISSMKRNHTGGYTKSRPSTINTILQPMQNQKVTTVTPSPVAAQLQKHTFVSPPARNNNSLTISSNENFDDSSTAFLLDIQAGKDLRGAEKSKLLDNSVNLTDLYSQALHYRGELTTLLEDMEGLDDILG